MEVKLGFSTGCLYKTGLNLHQQLEAIAALGCTAVELNFIKTAELVTTSKSDVCRHELAPFDYVSLHAPIYAYCHNNTTFDIFAAIRKINRIRNLDMVVFHPDTVHDFSVFEAQDFPVAFENMDKRKKLGQTPSDMLTIVAKDDDWGMVLDVNHAFTIDIDDAECRLASAFWQKLYHRIDQIHLSGHAPPDHPHWPLFKTKQDFIIRSIENFGVPIIVESILEPHELGQERNYILDVIDSGDLVKKSRVINLPF